MKISDRFAEYGITGAFFLITQALVLIFWFKIVSTTEWSDWMQGITATITPIPAALQASIGALLGVLGIISIFFTGLLLDMFGSLFIIREMSHFKKNLETNRSWIGGLVEENKEYVRDDFRDLTFGLSAYQRLFRMKRKSSFNPWKIVLAFVATVKRMFTMNRFLAAYNRFQSFLFSFVLVYSGASKLDGFLDQVSLWRTSRAISTTMIIVGLEAIVAAMLAYNRLFRDLANGMVASNWIGVVGLIALYFALLFLSWAITLRAYSRMCASLFSLAYVTHTKMANAGQSSAS